MPVLDEKQQPPHWDALYTRLPVGGVCRILVSFLEPLAWHKFIPDEAARCDLLRQCGITLKKRGRPVKVPGPLNSPDALFQCREAVFTSIETGRGWRWRCIATASKTIWQTFHMNTWVTHRDGDEPAEIITANDGRVGLWFYGLGSFDRDHSGNKPAIINRNTVAWYDSGRLHRGNGKPARMTHSGVYEWSEDIDYPRQPGYGIYGRARITRMGQVLEENAGVDFKKKMRYPSPQEVRDLIKMIDEETRLERWAN